jgi:hypothetical protein
MENLLLSDEVCPLCEVRFKSGQHKASVTALDGRKRLVCEYCHLESMHMTGRVWYIYAEMRRAEAAGDAARLAELYKLRRHVLDVNGNERAERLMHAGH